jgi:FkbM family methyltransferase
MGLSQLLLDGSQSKPFTLARAFHRLQAIAARHRDALAKYRLNGRSLLLPLSHDLPWNRRVHPTYGENLKRLATFVRQRRGRLVMIDVGANIGDSWALAGSGSGDAFLLIEGSPRWFELLERNTAADPAVTRVQALLSDRPGEALAALLIEGGNATVVAAAGGTAPQRYETLDDVIDRHPAFRQTHLLKVDVEGWDPKVLRGAARLLEGARPALFFEHYPRLLDAAGEDDQGVFRELANLGYGRLILYDHRGHLLESVATSDSARLGALMIAARAREGYYYDVCAIHDRDQAERERFLAAEVTWTARWDATAVASAPRAVETRAES